MANSLRILTQGLAQLRYTVYKLNQALNEDRLTNPQFPAATRGEIFAWSMYDFANSGYTTVVLTAVFNTYFVGVIAAGTNVDHSGTATLLWTIALAIANALVIISAPILGAIADHSARKKHFLILSSLGCILFTALLSVPSPGDIALTMVLVILATFMFSTGENLIAAFLPEIAPPEQAGRISGYGWTVGYLGGMLVLGLCLWYINAAQAQGKSATDYVPVCMLIVAACFALGALPTFLWLRERATPSPYTPDHLIRAGFQRLKLTLSHAHRFTDLFRFLVALTIYHCGVNVVIVLAAVYAQQVMGFTTTDTIKLILVVNITAALGALVFGHAQDRFGSVPTLALTLGIWIVAIVAIYFIETRAHFWLIANLIGIALGSSQSGGRALVSKFSPPQYAAEFFGLWGLAGKLAAIIGPLSYGGIAYLSQGNHRLAVLSTLVFFVVGLITLLTINEQRGKQAAQNYAT